MFVLVKFSLHKNNLFPLMRCFSFDFFTTPFGVFPNIVTISDDESKLKMDLGTESKCPC